MKKIPFLIALFFSIQGFSQTYNDRIDSTAIAFKAKLFTVSEYGIPRKEDIIQQIEAQNLQFLKTFYKKFLFMKIDFDQPYVFSGGGTGTLIRNCSYYMAYNCNSNKFYRLGGFDYVDIDTFIDDLMATEKDIVTFDSVEIEGVDILCLFEYHDMSKKKKNKLGFHCFEQCSKVTETMITVH